MPECLILFDLHTTTPQHETFQHYETNMLWHHTKSWHHETTTQDVFTPWGHHELSWHLRWHHKLAPQDGNMKYEMTPKEIMTIPCYCQFPNWFLALKIIKSSSNFTFHHWVVQVMQFCQYKMKLCKKCVWIHCFFRYKIDYILGCKESS